MLDIKLRWYTSIKEIKEADWKRVTREEVLPFFQWNWLNSLETSRSIINKNGWQPLFLTAWNENCMVGFAPLYLKSHSYGEFVFDNIFSELAFNLGLNYYPKIVGMSPLSPIEGYRFFFSPEQNETELTILMINAIDNFAEENNILSANFLYVDHNWKKSAEAANCLPWINQKSLYTVKDEENFSEYLKRFNSNQRKNIKKERKILREAGIDFYTKSGKELNSKDMILMYDLYEKHCSKWGVWGSKYLSKDFFLDLAKPMLKENIILFCAKRVNTQKTIGMSLCVKEKDMLWGRYWGSDEELEFLHFELCYYSPIEWAIKNKIKFFDPGAGGNQKRRRGFLAKPHFSLHRWYNKKMEDIIKEWLPEANDIMLERIKTTNSKVPFKN